MTIKTKPKVYKTKSLISAVGINASKNFPRISPKLSKSISKEVVSRAFSAV